MVTYNAPEQRYEGQERKVVSQVTIPYVKVMLWLALGLAIAAGVGYGWPWLMSLTSDFYTSQTISMVVAVIGILVCSFVIGWKAFGKKSVATIIFYLIDAVCYGILLSMAIMFADIATGQGSAIVAMSFGITALAFLGCGLVGMLSKNLYRIIGVVSILLLCVLTMSLINLFLMNYTLSWIIEFVIFAVMLIETALDFNRLKRMAAAGMLNEKTNLPVYCAFTLFADFIMLLIRIIFYMSLFSRRN